MKRDEPRGAARRPPTAVAPGSETPEPDGRPRLRRPPTESTAVLAVDPAELPEHVFRRLLGAYLGGARAFVVREEPTVRPATRSVVGSFCRRTRGPEVVAEAPDRVEIEDREFDRPIALAPQIDRMGRRVIAFHREAVAGWSGLPLGEDGYWERRDDEIDREAWFLQRRAARLLGATGDAGGFLELWLVARSLERIADHAVTLGEAGRRLVGLPHGLGPIATLVQFHGQAMEHLEGVLSAASETEANELLDTGEALLASGRAIADRLLPTSEDTGTSPAAAAAIARILESIGRTIAYAQDIAQVVLDRRREASPGGRAVAAVAAAVPGP
jgi:phosphate uptake regulator